MLGRLRIRLHPLLRGLSWRRMRGAGAELLPFLRPVRSTLVLALVCSLGGVLTTIARPWPVKMVFDYALTPAAKIKWIAPFHLLKGSGPMGVVTTACVLLFAITLLWGLFVYYQRYLIASAGQQVTFALRRRLFAHLQRLSLSFHRRQHVGDLLLRATGDTNMLREMLVDAVLIVSTEFLVLVAMVGVMLYMDWQLTMISLAILPLLGVAVFRISTELRAAVRTQRRREGRMAAQFGEMLQAIAVIQSFGREAHEEARFDGANRRSLRQARRTVRLEANLERAAEVLLAAGTGAVLWFGVRRVLAGVLTPGDLLVFTAYLASSYRPLRRLAFVASRLSKALTCAERVFAVLAVDERVTVRRDAVPAPPFKGRVTFKDVGFAYEPGCPVLHGVSFTALPGQTIAVVGPNGAGKSTLCALLPRLYDPTTGSITIDGEKVTRFTLDSLREQIGVVLQEPLLFAATVRENIAYGRPAATDAEIVAAARAAAAHDFIAALPRGYETVIGERGATLSGGQRQKVALARAIIKDPPLLILDEPTVSLDASAAAQVSAALGALARRRTTFRVGHRLAEIQHADVILVIEDGRITQRGTHAELVAKAGWYRDVYALQAGLGDAVEALAAPPRALGARP
jgi:ATP-binding cassette subfamily B protein